MVRDKFSVNYLSDKYEVGGLVRRSDADGIRNGDPLLRRGAGYAL
jgi:hypothetical protein